MIFDFRLMVDRTYDPMDLSQMISALMLVFKLTPMLSANERAEIVINLKTDLKVREHESAQFSVSLIQMWLWKALGSYAFVSKIVNTTLFVRFVTFRALSWNNFYWRDTMVKMKWLVDNIDAAEFNRPSKTFIQLIIEPELSGRQF